MEVSLTLFRNGNKTRQHIIKLRDNFNTFLLLSVLFVGVFRLLIEWSSGVDCSDVTWDTTTRLMFQID